MATVGSSIESSKSGGTIKVTATPGGGTFGYHSPDPNWKATKAEDWGLEFVGWQFGETLVISTRNEIGYMHHRYTLNGIKVTVPVGVNVLLSPRTLSGDGRPDLSAP